MEELKVTVTAVVATNRFSNNVTETPIFRRNRNRWAVALKRTGRTYYTSGGRRVVSDAQHPVILPKGSCYSWECVEAGECLLIEFDAPESREAVMSFSFSDSALFEKTFAEIRKNLPLPGVEAGLACLHSLYGLLLALARSGRSEYAPKQKQQLLAPAVEYITGHYDNSNLTNDRLAALCGISTVYFRKCFEALYGKPPIRFLHEVRIRRAKDLLESDYDSITQVAETVGYSSVYHFSKMFRLYTGQSPTEYAKTSR